MFVSCIKKLSRHPFPLLSLSPSLIDRNINFFETIPKTSTFLGQIESVHLPFVVQTQETMSHESKEK